VGKYQQTTDLIEQFVLDYTTLKIVPRGTPIFPDMLMTGAVRFARRLGSNFSVLNPDNQVTLTSNVTVENSNLPVSRILPGFEVGALLTFNSVEMLQVADWTTDGTNMVMIQSPLTTARSSGDPLSLWATPMVVHADSAAGATTITVRSRYNLLNGDVVTLPVGTQINSLQELPISIAQTAGTAQFDTEFPNIYTLNLSKPCPISLVADTSPIYLRAYPAYLSQALAVPKLSASTLGPFLLDYMGSPLDSVQSYNEVFSVATFDGGNNAIEGTANSLLTVAKNHPVCSRPIAAENILFWKVVRGSGGFVSPNKYRLITDSEGYGRVATRIIPSMPGGFTWTFKVTPTASGLIRFYTETPGAFQDYPVQAHVTSIVTLTTPSNSTVDRIEILANLDSTANAEVVIADSVLQGPVVSTFQYGLVLQVIGQTNYQCTGVIVKPYFLSLSDLTADYDNGKTYNGGVIYG
jgi:hypothetical protein